MTPLNLWIFLYALQSLLKRIENSRMWENEKKKLELFDTRYVHGFTTRDPGESVDDSSRNEMKEHRVEIVNPQTFVQTERVIPQDRGTRYCDTINLVPLHEIAPCYGILAGWHAVVDRRIFLWIWRFRQRQGRRSRHRTTIAFPVITPN